MFCLKRRSQRAHSPVATWVQDFMRTQRENARFVKILLKEFYGSSTFFKMSPKINFHPKICLSRKVAFAHFFVLSLYSRLTNEHIWRHKLCKHRHYRFVAGVSSLHPRQRWSQFHQTLPHWNSLQPAVFCLWLVSLFTHNNILINKLWLD